MLRCVAYLLSEWCCLEPTATSIWLGCTGMINDGLGFMVWGDSQLCLGDVHFGLAGFNLSSLV